MGWIRAVSRPSEGAEFLLANGRSEVIEDDFRARQILFNQPLTGLEIDRL